MADDLKVGTVKQWDDVLMQQDGSVREVTRVRFFIGTHGPFERVFDRTVNAFDVERAITDKRDELQRLAQL